jgi:hypothetical protein
MVEDDRQWDRFDLDAFCQHCGQHLTMLVGMERAGMAAARAASLADEWGATI